MKQQEIADLSAELIIKYYENDYMPFLESFDDDSLWYGRKRKTTERIEFGVRKW